MANDGWFDVLLEDVAEDVTVGYVGPMASEYVAAGIPFLRSQNVERLIVNDADLKFISPSFHGQIKKSALSPGDVVIVRTGKPGACAVIPASLPVANCSDLVIVRCGPKLDPRFLAYYVNSAAAHHVDSHLVGAVQQHFNVGSARKMVMHCPEVRDQRAIAHILGTLDDKIELNRRINETLEAIARALFKSWFVDFDPVRAKAEGRDPGLPPHLAALFPDRYEDSELGEIPLGWTVESLGDLITTVKGCSYASSELVESATALVTLKSFARGGGYRPGGLKSFAGTYKPEQVVEPGELVLACTDVTQAAEVIGRTALVRESSQYKTLVASLDVMILRPLNDHLTRAFLYFLGRIDEFTEHTYAHTTGTTVLHLAKTAVPSFQFALPPRLVVRAFDSTAAPVLRRIEEAAGESDTLATLRDALLPKLISGEIRVKDAERVVEEAV